MKALVIIAAAIYCIFVLASIHLFGLRVSYISFAPKWKEKVKIHNVNLWGLVTVVIALLLVIPAIDAGAGTTWQWVCYLLPASLAVVGLAGDRPVGYIADMAFWGLTIAFVLLTKSWPWLIITPSAAIAIALTTHSVKECGALWADLAMALAVFGSLLT